ncbi:MutS family protein MSH5 [Sporobolomyces koalae]|uniref:MutS family protein MSH5 n=1 Tax=Sporobolomyces koalae TaxID=500713 RepID=UPI00317DAE6C
MDIDKTRKVRWARNDDVGHVEDAHGRPSDENGSLGEAEEAEVVEDATITLAITSLRGRLGCAYYEASTNKLHFLQDQLDSSEFDLASLVLEQLLPTNVLSPSNADANFSAFLEETLSSLPAAPSASSSLSASLSDLPTRLEIRPARDFYAGHGRRALSTLNVREGAWYADAEGDGPSSDHDSEDTTYGIPNRGGTLENDSLRRNRDLRLESFINGPESSPLALGCAGALVSWITRTKAAEGDLEAAQFDLAGLELMKLDRVMLINAESLTSLQIFEQEAHASMHAARGREGLSIFNILNLTRSSLGSSLMRQWLIRPSLELSVIEQRHETVACLLRPENAAPADTIRSHLKSVKNPNKAVLTLLHGRGKLREWTTLYQMVYSSILIRDAALVLVRSSRYNAIDKAIFFFWSFRIDWESSALQKGRVCVRPGVDSELDKLRRQLNGLPTLLSNIAKDLSMRVPEEIVSDLSFVYFPQLGYLIRTPPTTTAQQLEGALSSSFEFQFEGDNSAYFKNDRCRDLDLHVGDLQSLVVDKEIEIVQALVERVEVIEGAIQATSRVLAELDCLLAFAEAARDNHWSCPIMTEEPVCRISGGRHPLAELCSPTGFIKNDVDLIGGRGDGWSTVHQDESTGNIEHGSDSGKSMIIIAGANFSGKSVYLKQIALITYLAHIGSFVPADKALIGLTDRIMTRVTTRESITRGASAFMIDLQQMSYMLRNMTPRSLLVIDEFGKGTDSSDGAGLFCGVIEMLLNLGRNTPRTAVATHFQSVFANGLLSRTLPAHLAHMQVMIDPDASLGSSSMRRSNSSSSSSSNRTYGVESLTYLYRLAPGLMTRSHAAACAQAFDIPIRIVTRAEIVTQALINFDLDTVLRGDSAEDNDSTVCQLEEKEIREGEMLANTFVEWDLDELEGAKGECDLGEIKQTLLDMLA